MIVVKKKMALVFILVMALATFGFSASAQAADSATQTVTFEVQAINEISVTGTPSLTISTATPGSGPTAATDNSATYAITTNDTGKTITAAIDTAMPTGLTLKVSLAAPTVGTSAGDVILSATAADVVTGVGSVAESGLTITYTLEATIAAGVVSSTTRDVTFTIADAI